MLCICRGQYRGNFDKLSFYESLYHVRILYFFILLHNLGLYFKYTVAATYSHTFSLVERERCTHRNKEHKEERLLTSNLQLTFIPTSSYFALIIILFTWGSYQNLLSDGCPTLNAAYFP